jgi:hypothetical protein
MTIENSGLGHGNIGTMKRKRPFKRNLFLLSFLLFVFVGLVVAVQFIRHDPVYFDLEEMNRRNAIRTDPAQNGWFVLKEAIVMLPEKPKPIMVPFEGYVEFPSPYKPINGSMGRYLGVSRLDSDPAMAEYIDACRPAIEHAAFALDKPELLTEFPPKLNWIIYDDSEVPNLGQLYNPMYAASRMDFLQNQNPKRGAEILLVLFKLQLNAAKDLEASYNGRFYGGLSLIQKVIIHAGSERNLKYIEALINQIKESFIDPHIFLSKWFTLLDNTNHYPTTATAKERGLSWKDRFFFWQLSRASGYLNTNHEFFHEMAALPTSEHVAFFRSHHAGKDILKKRSGSSINLPDFGISKYFLIYEWFSQMANAKHIQAQFASLPITLALQRYHNKHGRYPDKIDPLVPDFLETIPVSHVSNTPFQYQKTETGYSIFDTGYNRLEWDGKTRPSREFQYVAEEIFDTWPPVEEPVKILEMPQN